ncbi:MAG TPA: hypothetical protein VJR94_10385 [Candidatus Nitrosocosmicus sp.]|nr:hypothetical protein [Candidatus Nitrosocosmicus sp.]
MNGLKPPFRIVGRLVDKLDSKEQIEANLALEKAFHSKFDKFSGMVLCHYDMCTGPTNTKGKWIQEILKNHHSAICLTESGNGVAFNMR